VKGDFLIDTLDEAVSAVHESNALDRAAVRASVETRFDVDRMVDDYLALYGRVIELHRAGQVPRRAVR